MVSITSSSVMDLASPVEYLYRSTACPMPRRFTSYYTPGSFFDFFKPYFFLGFSSPAFFAYLFPDSARPSPSGSASNQYGRRPQARERRGNFPGDFSLWIWRSAPARKVGSPVLGGGTIGPFCRLPGTIAVGNRLKNPPIAEPRKAAWPKPTTLPVRLKMGKMILPRAKPAFQLSSRSQALPRPPFPPARGHCFDPIQRGRRVNGCGNAGRSSCLDSSPRGQAPPGATINEYGPGNTPARGRFGITAPCSWH